VAEGARVAELAAVAGPASVAEPAPVAEPVEAPAANASDALDAGVIIRYFAAAADAAGTLEETLPRLATVGALRAELIARHGDAMARVLASGSFLVDGVVSRDDARTLGARVDVLPPFAGG
jgi:molybdopterin synthase sulfur carrier subunit